MIILASGSPRRQELLRRMGLDFTVRAADIDESMDASRPAHDEVRRVAERKAEKAAQSAAAEDVIIAADTIVVVDGRILGKPADEQDAQRMLRLLSGRTHQVMTGLCVRSANRIESETVVTDVTFRALSEQEIAAYIATGDPMDKAGSYGVQGRAAAFVSGLNGDFFSVMGLPVCRLCEILRSFQVKVSGV